MFGETEFAVETAEHVEKAWKAASRGELGPAVCFTGSMYLAGKVAELRKSRRGSAKGTVPNFSAPQRAEKLEQEKVERRE
jgi:hypothetical protein